MGSRTVNKNSNRWEGNVYIYLGGDIDGVDKGYIEHVRVHESVAVVHENAFRRCYNVQAVEFSTNRNSTMMIKEIGNKSFFGCRNLLSIDLQSTQVETIGDRTFYDCKHLTTIQFPSSVRRIGKSAFHECDQLKAVDLSHVNDLETIEDCTFSCCFALTTIKLPTTTSRIGAGSFYSCGALETVDLLATCVTEIGEGAFRYCGNLTAIFFPTTTKSIGQGSFFGCNKLSLLNLQATSVERMENDVFSHCYDMNKINLPKTVKYIGQSCFESCTKLECINLHETSLEKIDGGAFHNCTNLTTIVGISSHYRKEEGEVTLQEKNGLFHRSHMKLPASLVEVGKDAFGCCLMLQNSIDTNRIHYLCDLNRGGRIFIHRHHPRHDNENDDGSTNEYTGRKVYYSSLWPMILYRIMNEMELPRIRICSKCDDLSLYTKADPIQRRGSVVFYLLVHGVIADLQTTTTTTV